MEARVFSFFLTVLIEAAIVFMLQNIAKLLLEAFAANINKQINAHVLRLPAAVFGFSVLVVILISIIIRITFSPVVQIFFNVYLSLCAVIVSPTLLYNTHTLRCLVLGSIEVLQNGSQYNEAKAEEFLTIALRLRFVQLLCVFILSVTLAVSLSAIRRELTDYENGITWPDSQSLSTRLTLEGSSVVIAFVLQYFGWMKLRLFTHEVHVRKSHLSLNRPVYKEKHEHEDGLKKLSAQVSLPQLSPTVHDHESPPSPVTDNHCADEPTGGVLVEVRVEPHVDTTLDGASKADDLSNVE